MVAADPDPRAEGARSRVLAQVQRLSVELAAATQPRAPRDDVSEAERWADFAAHLVRDPAATLGVLAARRSPISEAAA